MHSLRVHSFVNMGLSLVLALGAIYSFSLPYFSSGDYEFGLFSLQHPLQFEDVHGDVSIPFPRFISFACSVSESPAIIQVCDDLPSLQLSGRLYFLLTLVFITTLFLSLLDTILSETVNHRYETLMQVSHYVSFPIYLSAVVIYLVICNEMTDSNSLFGVIFMVILVVLCVLLLAHYLYWRVLLRKYRLENNGNQSHISTTGNTQIDYSRYSVDDLRKELEAKNEALARSQALVAEQHSHLRATQDLGRELSILRSENSSLSRQLNALIADTEAGLTGNEKALFMKLKESDRNRMTLERQLTELRIENSALRDGSDRSIKELLEAKERQIAELAQGETIDFQRPEAKVAAGAGVQEVEIVDPVSDFEREKDQLTAQIHQLHAQNQHLISTNTQLNLDISTEQNHVKALKSQTNSLQEQLETALQRLGVQQDVDEVKGLLEESRRKELEDMKSLYEKRFNALIEEEKRLRVELDAVEMEKKRKEMEGMENKKKKDDAEKQVKSLEEEINLLKRHLEETEQQRRDAITQHLRSDFELKQRLTELEILREQLKSMEETHTKAVAELTNSRGDQLEAIKKLYAEATQKDFEEKLAVYISRIEKLQADIEAERLEKGKIEAKKFDLERESKTNAKQISDLNATIANQSAQLEELVIKLAHIQTLQTQTTDENTRLKRTVTEQKDQIRLLETAQDDLQSLNSKVLRDQETRHEKEIDRMKELYEGSQVKEMDELKKFYEQKIGKIHGDLVNERQERLQVIDQVDKLTKDKETLQVEIDRFQRLIEKQKYTFESSENMYKEEISALKDAKKSLEEHLIRLKSELIAANVNPEEFRQLEERLKMTILIVNERENTIKEQKRVIEDLENGTNAPIALKEELRTLREKNMKTEEELMNVKQEIASKETEIQRLNNQISQILAEKVEFEQSLQAVNSQKIDIEKQGKVIKEKLDRKRGKLSLSREKYLKLSSEKDKELQEITENYKLDKEKLRQSLTEAFGQDVNDIKLRYENKLSSLQAELKNLQTENVTQIGKLAEMTSEKGKIVRMNREMTEELSDLKRQFEEMRGKMSDLRGKNDDLMEENESLKALIASLRRSKGESHSQVVESLEAQVSELNRLSKTHAESAENIGKEMEELRNELRQKEGELQSVKEECMALHTELLEMQGRSYMRSKSSTSMSREEKRSGMTPDSSQSVKEIMIIDGITGTDKGSNPILEKVATLKKEAPMTYSNVWKFFESMMQEKCKLDKLEMEMNRQPRTMTEFMLDYVNLKYGLRTLALRQLQALVIALQSLYQNQHTYGVLFCRFLGLFHPRPLPHHLAIYLLVVGEAFNSLAEKYRPRRPEKFAEQYDLLQYGGQASLIDLMELITKICKGDRSAGERIISNLTLDLDNKVEITLLKVCGTMARMGRDPKYMFEILDLDQGGAVDYHELVDGIRLKLNIWVSQEEAVDLCGYIDETGIGQITLEEWTSKVNFTDYMERESAIGMISKANFMNALISEYETEVVQDYYILRKMIKRSYMDQSSVEEFLLQVDPGLESNDLVRYYEEILQQDSDFRSGISPEAACIVVLRRHIGNFGIGIFGEV